MIEGPPSPSMGPIGIFGGTFDPIHYGHLRTAFELLEGLSLSEVRFIPCGTQPLREVPAIAGELRLRMVEAAVAAQPEFSVDTRELQRVGPSYSVDTLVELRDEQPSAPLCLILGMDAFLSLPRWHRWQEILSLAHIVVAHRPGWQIPAVGALGDLIRERGTEQVRDLHRSGCGSVYIRAVTQLEISATALRDSIRAGLDPRYLVPESVSKIIAETRCYAATVEERADV